MIRSTPEEISAAWGIDYTGSSLFHPPKQISASRRGRLYRGRLNWANGEDYIGEDEAGQLGKIKLGSSLNRHTGINAHRDGRS